MRRPSPLAVAVATFLLAACTGPAAPAAPPATAGPGGVEARGAAQPRAEHVLAISVDALNPDALRQLGRDGAPWITKLVRRGAHTLNARASVELTDTLPNHTSMVTGRRVTASRGGHGVTWNDERLDPPTVQAAAGHPVSSVFSQVHAHGGSTALFSTKTKLSLFERSWPDALDRTTIRASRDGALASAARKDLVRHHRDLTFVHFGAADVAGHAHGFMGPEYLDAVSRVDRLVGRLVRVVRSRPSLADTVVILTADHGGRGSSHHDPTLLANYRIPFTVWGPGVRAGNLYARNPAFRAPEQRRVGYDAARQPVRNGDVANLALDLLGLRAVPGSEHDAAENLQVG